MSTQKFQHEIDSFHQSISVETIGGVADQVFRDSLEDLIRQTKADAGAVWVADKESPDSLTIAINVGEKGDAIEGNVSQQLESGLVSRAFNEGVFVHDDGVFRPADQCLDVDMQLGQFTIHQMASPFKMFGKTIGAVTAIQLSTATNPPAQRAWGFDDDSVRAFQCWVSVAQRLAEYSIVGG